MGNNYRILLHTISAKRDIGSLFILGRILERFGCRCYITSDNNVTSFINRLWRPHAIFFVTDTRASKFKKIYPNAKLFFCPGEGGELYENSIEKYLIEKPKNFDSITKMYCWGRNSVKNLYKRINEIGEKSPYYHNHGEVNKKIEIIGHPRLDSIKYFPYPKMKNNKLKVGFIGQFNMINPLHYYKRSTLRYALDVSPKSNKLPDFVFQANLLKCYCDIMDRLGYDSYDYNIRPYPIESRDQYLDANRVKNGQFQVDQNIEFSTWLCQQDVVIGPTSSTIGQIAFARKPYINTDILNDRDATTYKQNMRKYFFAVTKKHAPKDFDELLTMIKNYREHVLSNVNLGKLLDDLYNIDNYQESVLLRIAINMMKYLRNSEKQSKRSYLPFLLLLYANSSICNLRKNKYKSNYNVIDYKTLLPKLSKEFDPIVEGIFNDHRNQKILRGLN